MRCRGQLGGARRPQPAQPLHGQHARGGELGEDARDAHRLFPLEHPAETPQVRRFDRVVDLLLERPRQLVHDRRRLRHLELDELALGQAGQVLQDLDVGLDDAPQPRPLHLDHHLGARPDELGGMDLSQRGRGERLRIEAAEDALDRSPELALDDPPRLLSGERNSLILELLELLGDVERNEVGTGGQELAQLDERRPELLERAAQALSAADRLDGTGLVAQRPPAEPEMPQHADPGQHLPEAVTDQHGHDLPVAAEVAVGALELADPREHPR